MPGGAPPDAKSLLGVGVWSEAATAPDPGERISIPPATPAPASAMPAPPPAPMAAPVVQVSSFMSAPSDTRAVAMIATPISRPIIGSSPLERVITSNPIV